MRGFIYVAYGDRARQEFKASIESLRVYNHNPIAVISDSSYPEFKNATPIYYADTDPGARQAKLQMDLLSPFDFTFYLDADTRPHASFDGLFKILEGGWDMIMAVNQSQDKKWLWNIGESDRRYTLEAIGHKALALQGGVIGFRKSDAIYDFFNVWRHEWTLFGKQDQGALLRALHECPVKLWLLGTEWNGGVLVEHYSGKARRRNARSHR